MQQIIKKGQVAIMLVLITAMLATITTAAVAVAFSTTRDTTTTTLGERALMVAESGAENALLRLLRDPNYPGESNLSIGPGSATIGVTGSGPLTITSTATVGTMVRQIRVVANVVGGVLTIVSWQEI
jgi:hypothetical protein